MLKAHWFSVFAMLLTFPALAEVGTTAAAWMKIPGDARVTAMGEAGTALDGDLAALDYNPAGLSGVQLVAAKYTNEQWLTGISLNRLSVGGDIPYVGVLALGLDDVNFGTFDSYSGSSTLVDSYTATAMDLKLGLAHRFGPVSLGLTGKSISESLGSASASTMSGDVGVGLNPVGGLNLGLSMLNCFGTLYGAPLEKTLRGGVAYDLKLPVIFEVTMLADYAVPLDTTDNWEAGTGVELNWAKVVFVRAGYVGHGLKSDDNGLRLGAGVGIVGISVNYTYFNYGELGTVSFLTLSYAFDKDWAFWEKLKPNEIKKSLNRTPPPPPVEASPYKAPARRSLKK
jgi:hypothetical protein